MNIYVIGDWIGAGIQWLVLRYNLTPFGESVILYSREIQFIFWGIYTGKTAISTIFWGLGTMMIIIASIICIHILISPDVKKMSLVALCNGLGVIFLLTSIITLYGFILHGPAGIAIPFGIPVIIGVAYFQYRSAMNEMADDQDDGEDNLSDNPAVDEPKST